MTDAARVRILTRTVERLRSDREHWRAIFEDLPVAALHTDQTGTVLDINARARNLLNADETGLGKPHTEVLGVERRRANQRVEGLVEKAIASKAHTRARGVLVVHDSETRLFVDVHAMAVVNDGGVATGVVLVVEDLSEMRDAAERLRLEAEVDPLTGMLRRAVFERNLDRAVQQVRSGGDQHALCYLDLDHFKPVNDTAGHQAGDQLLRELAQGVRDCVRGTDLVARLGGDEFAVLLYDCDAENAEVIANKIRAWVDAFRFQWGERQYQVSVSVGVVMLQSDMSTAQVIDAADAACYAAKAGGRNQVRFHSAAMPTTPRHGGLSWAMRLERALHGDGLELYHQPIFRAGQGHPRLAEVLLRLSDDGSLFKPDEFLDANARAELRRDVDRWVLERVISGLATSHYVRPGIDTWFVNISVASLADESFAEFVREVLGKHRFPAASLCLEVTETAALKQPFGLRAMTDLLTPLGVRLALDKFGREACSLTHLRSAQLNFVKLDSSLLGLTVSDEQVRIMLRAVIDLAHSRGIEVVATGVEAEATEVALTRLHADYLQGFLLEEPSAMPTL